MLSSNGLQPDIEYLNFKKGISFIAGVDEVGRGAMAGPVVAAAYLLKSTSQIVDGVDDSKKLNAKFRALKEHELRDPEGAWSIGSAQVEEINELGIVAATLVAMKRSLIQLPEFPELILIDGTFRPGHTNWFPANCVWSAKADSSYYCVAAASILAKEYRDRYMVRLACQNPGYGFDQNKGYGTLNHRRAIRKLGLTSHHRLQFCRSVWG